MNAILLPGVLVAMLSISMASVEPGRITTHNAPGNRMDGAHGGEMQLQSRPLFRLRIDLGDVIEIGSTPSGTRRLFTVKGGEFNGNRVNGTVVASTSGDWLLVRADGSLQQDVRLVLITSDDALILMTYRGVRHASADVLARMSRGEQVARNEYYLRTAPFFETADPRYSWLNRIVAVGIGERVGDSVFYDVHEIL